MTKQEIHRLLIAQVQHELESITAAAKKSFATATSEEHRAEGKYDTFKLESSFLSRGLAKRVEELTRALDSLQQDPLPALKAISPAQLGALVRLRAEDGTTRALFLGADAGGESITVDGEEITIVTARSPLGAAVLGKHIAEAFDFKIGAVTHNLMVVSVE